MTTTTEVADPRERVGGRAFHRSQAMLRPTCNKSALQSAFRFYVPQTIGLQLHPLPS